MDWEATVNFAATEDITLYFRGASAYKAGGYNLRSNVLVVEPEVPEATRTTLRRLGHRVVEGKGLGAVQLVRRAADGSLEAAADPRKGGEAAAW